MSASLELRRQLLEADGAAAEALGEPDRAVVAAVGDEDGLDAAGGERARGQLGRLAGADQQHAALGEVAERPLRELDGDRRDGDRALADPGLGADPLAGGERAAEEPVEDRAGRALDQRELVGALDLALDLGLAEDHRVEPGGDPEEVAGGLEPRVGVEALDQLGRADAGLAGERAERQRLGLDRVGDDQVELGPVAGRDRGGLADRARRDQVAEHAAARPSVSARRSRSSSGAVLWEMPRASSSGIRPLLPALGQVGQLARARARSARAWRP